MSLCLFLSKDIIQSPGNGSRKAQPDQYGVIREAKKPQICAQTLPQSLAVYYNMQMKVKQ